MNEVIIPPFPITKSYWLAGNSFDTNGIENSLTREFNVCVLVAHAGESFVGYSHSMKEFDSFQIIKSSVKAKHGKGGFSQRRFERLRDEDIVHHIEKVKPLLKSTFEEFDGNIDYFFVAGDSQMAKEITVVAPLDIKQITSSSDIRIEKHNISDILKQLTICRRYKL
ncbi:MAG: Vms1/Ankzf1 family peptidyl-tRNA hydrolase [Methanolobus sp.]